ncbi:ATP-dependent DNA helicase RecG [Nocardioides massiliensis]|uniref:ATP-dependent DNA helicase RecG n=3 Tax=Nocardioides massiliensis TaxID=1325935 RepID=UPI00351FBE7E
MAAVSPHTRLSQLAGGKKGGEALAKLGLHTVADLLHHHPRRYVAKGELSTLADMEPDTHVSVVGRVVDAQVRPYTDRRTNRQAFRVELVVAVEGGRLLLTFFDRRQHIADWRMDRYRPGTVGIFSGKLGEFRGQLQLTHPDATTFGSEDDAALEFELQPDLTPVYPASAKVQTWQLRDLVKLVLELLDDWPEVVPTSVRRARGLVTGRQALEWIHRPTDLAQVERSQEYWKFAEAFTAQTLLARRRVALRSIASTARLPREGGLLDAFDQRLPFELTQGQQEVSAQILDDLAQTHPMQRLLQGEVGSGKTIVALRAMLRTVDGGGQAALLAPTEVLAQQHARSLREMLGPLAEAGMLGGSDQATRVTLLTGSLPAAARRAALLEIASGAAGIVVGTHALLQEKVDFADLGLVVVDEQHRFGVEQRAELTAKSDRPPHLLVMTATPIPRTVAMTVFGDLETSLLTEVPRGRAGVQTTLVPISARPGWLDRAWERISEEVAAGHQAFVLCPKIEADGDDPAGAAVESVADLLAAGPLAALRVDRLHGRQAPDHKDKVMRAFAEGEIDVLVCTTVVEVGVDVPNATVMVVLDADRFGLSQLHQIRGRVGRGSAAGLCLLVTRVLPDSPSFQRLQAMADTSDGFAVAQLDLATRREGDVLGAAQAGTASGFRHLSVVADEHVIAEARDAAAAYLAEDPALLGAPDLMEAVSELEHSGRGDYLERG